MPAHRRRGDRDAGKAHMKARPCPWCQNGRLLWTQWAGTLQCSSCRAGTVSPTGEPVRVRCLVPHCDHTRGDRKDDQLHPGAEWICGEHWRRVPRRLKLIRSRLRRRRARLGGKMTAVMQGIENRSWELCKRAAIEAAGGL